MTPIPLLPEIAIVTVVAVFVTVILGRFQLPTVAGLLASGALLGPDGLRLVNDHHSIEVLSEVGVVLLLFTIGLEFSLGHLKSIFRQVALGGALQVGGSILVTYVIARALGVSSSQALFFGFVVALSSTAIVLRTLGERQELDAPHGRFIVGTLIFQDLCVIPMVLLVPLLGDVGGDPVKSVGIAMGKAVLVVVFTLGIASWFVPRILGWVAKGGSREVFLLAVLALCVGTAWLTSLAGLSLALGAFLGGMVVADTEYRHRAMGDMLPLRDVFVSIFFVSLGMFFNYRVVIESPGTVLLLCAGFILGKGLIATVAAMLMRFPPRAAWLAGVGLAQFGEFGFVLVRLGESSNVVSAAEVDPLLCAGILSMFATPLMVRAAPHIRAGERLLTPLSRLLGARSIEEEKIHTHKDHVVIVGYGVAGQLVARSLDRIGRDYLVLELNDQTVKDARAKGEPVFYADATSTEALDHAHVNAARAVVILINDPKAADRVVDAIRRSAPNTPIFLRTHYLSEALDEQRRASADVVADEVEGGVEVLARVLRELEAARNVIDAEVQSARNATQPTRRRLSLPASVMAQHRGLAELVIETACLNANSRGVGHSLAQLDLRRHTGALLVATRRNEHVQPASPHVPFEDGDVLYLVGEPHQLERAVRWLSESPDTENIMPPRMSELPSPDQLSTLNKLP